MTALANAVFLSGAVLSMSGAAIAQTPQKSATQSSAQFQVGVHLSRAKPDSGEPDMGAIARETADAIAGNIEQPVMTPTRSSFVAKWQPVKGATGYRLDVSTTPSFDSCVSTYRDLDVGNVSSHIVAGLNRGTRYYYRVRPYNSAGTGDNSETTSETTANISSGLVIVPTFDSTITNDPRSSAIQAMIISAIQKYQTLFGDPITVSIRFRYSGYRLEGDPMGTLIGASNSGIHQLDWDPYIAALRADGKTANDMSANATLPTSALEPIMLTNSALGRAVGLNTPPVMFADGSLGIGGPYDGIITINSLEPVQFTRPVSPGNFDGQMFTEHEIDEVLGSGSHLNIPLPQRLAPIDLFSWASLNARNYSAIGQRFFSIDQGFHLLAQFNQNPDGDFGDYDSDGFCPATRLYVQNAFNCAGQSTDISATSPEGISLDVIGYDLVSAPVANADIIWQNTSTGQRVIWLMNGITFQSFVDLGTVGTSWSIAGSGDFNGDGKADILWQNSFTGQRVIWFMNGTALQSFVSFATIDPQWSIAGSGDFNGDGKSDIIWENTFTGQRVIWLMNGTALQSFVSFATGATSWSIAGSGDFNGDGKADILWQNTSTGEHLIWLMNGTALQSSVSFQTMDPQWSIAGSGDFNGDGKSDILWQNTVTGQRVIWLMNGTTFQSFVSFATVDPSWSIRNH
jgi:hypothetical protein